MVKDSFILKAEMKAEVKRINLGLRSLASLHRKFQRCMKEAAENLSREISQEYNETEAKIKAIALHMLEGMASEEFETLLGDFSLSEECSLSLSTSYYGFISMENFMDLSAYAKELSEAAKQMPSEEYTVWEKQFYKDLEAKLSKEARMIAKSVIQVLNAITGYVFFLKRIVGVRILELSNDSIRTEITFEVDFK